MAFLFFTRPLGAYAPRAAVVENNVPVKLYLAGKEGGVLVTTEQLKEYLGIVVDMEKDIFLKEQLIHQYQIEIDMLGIEKEFCRPKQPVKIVTPHEPKPPEAPTWTVFRNAIRGFGICVGIYVGMGLLEVIFGAGFTAILEWAFGGSIMGGLVAVVVFVLSLISNIISRSKYRKKMVKYYDGPYKVYQEECQKIIAKNQDREKIYQEQLAQYEKELENDKKRLVQEEIRKVALDAEIKQVQAQRISSKEILGRFYSQNIVFPKYRNMVMVCSLYEYICAGRCNSLEGHEGAYNILETEIRLERIVTQLDKVISMLDGIHQTQYVIYTAIQEANRKLGTLKGEMNQMVMQFQQAQEANYLMAENVQASLQAIRENNVELQAQFTDLQKSSALTAYQAERTQKELAYMNRMDYLTGRNDGVFFNRPPV